MEIIEKYDIQLRKNGEYMTDWEKEKLEREIKNDMIIKLNLSINLTKRKMDTWEIFPKSEKQTELSFEGENQAKIEELKEGAFFEVSGLNQGEGQDLPEDQEGEGEDQAPEGEILDSLLEAEIEEDNNSSVKYLADQEKEYQRRKAAFENQEAASPKKKGKKAAAATLN
jgi:hypothetical protein